MRVTYILFVVLIAVAAPVLAQSAAPSPSASGSSSVRRYNAVAERNERARRRAALPAEPVPGYMRTRGDLKRVKQRWAEEVRAAREAAETREQLDDLF